MTHTASDHPPHLPQQSLLPLLQPPTRHAGAALEAHAGNIGPIAIILVFNGRGPGVVAARPLRRISSWLWRAPPTAHASVSCDAAATRQPLRPLIYHLHFTLLFFYFLETDLIIILDADFLEGTTLNNTRLTQEFVYHLNQ